MFLFLLSKHAFSPRSLIWNLKAACAILGSTSGLGGVMEAVFVHTDTALPSALPAPLLWSPPALFIHMTFRKTKGSGRGRPQAWVGKLWLSTVCGSLLSPEKVTSHLSQWCQERWPAFLMSTLVTETWGEVAHVTVRSSLTRSGRKGEIDEPGPGDLRAVLSIP